jgi:hypothetical protein
LAPLRITDIYGNIIGSVELDPWGGKTKTRNQNRGQACDSAILRFCDSRIPLVDASIITTPLKVLLFNYHFRNAKSLHAKCVDRSRPPQ